MFSLFGSSCGVTVELFRSWPVGGATPFAACGTKSLCEQRTDLSVFGTLENGFFSSLRTDSSVLAHFWLLPLSRRSPWTKVPIVLVHLGTEDILRAPDQIGINWCVEQRGGDAGNRGIN